jgi:rhodanese-related sulfurtransferase
MKKTQQLMLLCMLALSLGLSACQSANKPASFTIPTEVGKKVAVEMGSYTNLSPAELNSLLSKKDFLLINVHIPFEGNLAKTDLSIPYDRIGLNLDKLPDKTARIVLYCRSGRMSDIAARELVKDGYTNIWNLDGGMDAWKQAGLSIEN